MQIYISNNIYVTNNIKPEYMLYIHNYTCKKLFCASKKTDFQNINEIKNILLSWNIRSLCRSSDNLYLSITNSGMLL